MANASRIRLDRHGDTARLIWDVAPDEGALERALRALDDLGADAPSRVEIDLGPGARRLRHLLHRHGFRLEGIARGAAVSTDGVRADVLRYARLAEDPLSGHECFTGVMNSVTPRKRLIAHALVTDAAGRVLLCETSFKPDFELPGGIVEPHESPLTGLLRELAEEVNAELPIGRLLVADWLPPYLGWEDALELIFDSPTLDAAGASALIPDGREIAALHWLDPFDAAARMTEGAARHLLGALSARAMGTTVYLEGGRPPSESRPG